MKRILRNASLIKMRNPTRYYHYESSGRSIMGSPAEVPPPPSYKMGNVYESYPEVYQGFTHHELNPYVQHAVNSYDNWEYKEYGEWWNIGSFACNVLFFVYPVLMYIVVKIQHENSLKHKSCGMIKYADRNGWTPYQIHINDLQPV